MFTIDDLATIFIYMEYILPIALFVLIILYTVISHYAVRFKIFLINRRHDVKKEYLDTYWYTYKCRKCGKILYKQPSGVNTSFNKYDYIFRYAGKCKENS